VLAIIELLIFMAVVTPGFAWSHFTYHGWAGAERPSIATLGGIIAAIPFAIWFFLGIEGAAMAAEEAREPTRTIPRAYIAGIGTLVALAFGTMLFAGAVGDWSALANINDPLPQAMKIVVGPSSGWLHLLVWIGLLGLIASFHGIIIGYSRQIFALARAGMLPKMLAAIHPRWRTPHLAILAGGVVGIAAIYSDKLVTIAGQPLTASIVTMSALGAVVMYITGMLSLMRLRAREPRLERPFRVPLYPLFPLIALVIAVASLIAIIYYNAMVAGLFAALGTVGAVVTWRRARSAKSTEPDPMLQASAASTSASRLFGASDGA
jgi:ethanolamine permease